MIPAGFRLRKLARALAASILLVALLFHSVAPPASAASEIFIDHSVEVAFPVAMAFKVVARSTSNITKLRLHYRVERQNEADVTSEGRPQFEPGNPVNAQWVWDMRRGGLPPGAMVRYWWTAEDATGNRADTQPVTVSFEDMRYRWQSITSGPVTLLWYSGAREFADVLMDAAQQSLSKMRNEMGATPERKVRIFIYGSTQELQGATLFPQEWTGGMAFVDFDIIAIGVAPDNLGFGIRAVPHELSHWVVGQLTHNNYGAGTPVWLDEGFATNGEGPVSDDYEARVANAARTNKLFTIRSLSSPFPADPAEALLSYAESRSVVAYLISSFGPAKFNELLAQFRQGNTYDDALKNVYGFDQDGLDAKWRDSLAARTAGRLAAPVAADIALLPALAAL